MLKKINESKLIIKNKTKKFPDFIGTETIFFASDRLKELIANKLTNDKVNFIKVIMEKKNIG